MASTGQNMQLSIIQSLNTPHVTQLCLTTYNFPSFPREGNFSASVIWLQYGCVVQKLPRIPLGNVHYIDLLIHCQIRCLEDTTDDSDKTIQSLFLLQPTDAQIHITTVSLYSTLLHVSTSLCHPRGVLHLCLAKLHKFLKLKLLKLQFHKIIN